MITTLTITLVVINNLGDKNRLLLFHLWMSVVLLSNKKSVCV